MQPAIAEGCKRKRATNLKKTKSKRRKRMKKNKMIAENVTAPEARH